MAFIRIKTVKGVNYYYLVESKREGGKVRQKIVKYFGTTPPDGYVVPTKASYSVVTRKAVKKAGTTKTMGKVVPSVLPQTVSTTPPQTNLSLTPGRGGGKEPAEKKQRASPTHTPIHSEGKRYRNYTYHPIRTVDELRNAYPNFADFTGKLTPRELIVITERLKGKTLEQIGKELPDPVTKERVRQIEAKACRTLVHRAAHAGKRRHKEIPGGVEVTTNLPLARGRGGNRHPIAVKQFILDHLARVGEDYISGMHQAYKAALDQLARDRRRVYYYHHPVYFSFFKMVWALIQEEKVEFSGREEPSDDHRFKNWKYKPVRKFVRLVK